VLKELNAAALLFAEPSLPFAGMLVKRAGKDATRLVPRDSETRVFLHDIPFVREQEWRGKPKTDLAGRIIACLKGRKAVIIEGLGVVSTGGITVEQAYIGFSSIFHTAFVKYLLDLLVEGFSFPDEEKLFGQFRSSWLREPDLRGLCFDEGPIKDRATIMNEICRVGRYTVEKGYVDSFFGNISYFDGETIFISQTASSLDELEGHIDPVPLDGSSTAGLSASSELPAHRGIYVSSNYRAVLHGHPRFSIVLSMYCREKGCSIQDCNRLCDRSRSVCGVPIVAGETGAGGLARSVPAAISETGVCIVYGHGIFAAAEKDFKQAFMRMAGTENRCREEYFRLLERRT
jgi:ribulose-5-phosphate 4-epimerase/fuculose-1-phosphate aldolase